MYIIYKSRINQNKIKYRFMKSDNSNLTYGEFLNLLRNRDNDFLKMFRQELNRASSELIEPNIASYLWECVPVSRATINKPFEFVVVNSPELKRKQQNYYSFQEHFNRSGGSDVVSFQSLSGDAVLVSPVPIVGYQYGCGGSDNEIRDYKDIAGFNDDAPQCQWNSFWQEIGNRMCENLNNNGGNPLWLNTYGLVVNYLHMRIDSQPKYYQHQEYLRESNGQNRHEQPQIINVNLSVLKEQAISEINGEFAKEPTISPFELDSDFHQWENVIKNKTIREAIDGYKKQILVAIREERESKMSKRQPVNYYFQDNYDDWTREQFIAEINRLKAENEQLRNNQTLTSSERQERLQKNQEKLTSYYNALSQTVSQPNNSNFNFPTNLVVGGGILLAMVAIVLLFVVRCRKELNKK